MKSFKTNNLVGICVNLLRIKLVASLAIQTFRCLNLEIAEKCKES